MADAPHHAGAAAPPPEPAWDDLRIFLAIVAHGSIALAATSLGQSPSTLARRIKALEQLLGVPLFTRGPNSLVLTDAGRAVVEAAGPMAEAARAVPTIAAAFRPDPAAPVRITATISVTLFLSGHAVELSRAVAPAEIAFLPTRRKLDLPAGEADLALRMRRLPEEPSELVGRRIGRIAFAIYESAQRRATALVAPESSPDLSQQAAYLARHAQGRPIAARIGDMPTRHQAIRAGLGAGVLPCWVGDGDPQLRRCVAPEAAMMEDVFLLMHPRARQRLPVAKAADALAAVFRREARRLEGTAPPLAAE